tara:strand:+ start:173 stop:331 length:159 start_codon:yes stop_codon:yes gene_type:complete
MKKEIKSKEIKKIVGGTKILKIPVKIPAIKVPEGATSLKIDTKVGLGPAVQI